VSLRNYLIGLREREGYLTPQVVVEDARPANSVLHDRFEWDDAVAAEAHRIDQARNLLRSVRVQYVEPDGGVGSTRAFVSIERPPSPREYIPVEEVRQDSELTAIALRDAEREWRSLYSRFKHLEEFLAIVRRDVAA
jgi:hypothetical protein